MLLMLLMASTDLQAIRPAYGVLILTIMPVVALIIAPSLAVVLTAVFISKRATTEEMALVQLTDISGKALVDAYHAAVEHHLQLLRIIALGLIPQGILGTAALFVWAFMYTDCRVTPVGCTLGSFLGSLLFSLMPGSIAWLILFGIGVWLYDLATYAGIWLGTRSGESTVGIAIGVAVLFWSLILPLIWFIARNLAKPAGAFILLAAGLTLIALSAYTRTRSRKALESIGLEKS